MKMKIISIIVLIGLLSSFSAANAFEYTMYFHANDTLTAETSTINDQNSTESLSVHANMLGINNYICFYRIDANPIYLKLIEDLTNNGSMEWTLNSTINYNYNGRIVVDHKVIGYFVKDTLVNINYDKYS